MPQRPISPCVRRALLAPWNMAIHPLSLLVPMPCAGCALSPGRLVREGWKLARFEVANRRVLSHF